MSSLCSLLPDTLRQRVKLFNATRLKMRPTDKYARLEKCGIPGTPREAVKDACMLMLTVAMAQQHSNSKDYLCIHAEWT